MNPRLKKDARDALRKARKQVVLKILRDAPSFMSTSDVIQATTMPIATVPSILHALVADGFVNTRRGRKTRRWIAA